MANSFAVVPSPSGLNFYDANIVELNITIGSSYATASGGFTFDLTVPMQTLQLQDYPVISSGQQGGTYQPGVAYSRVAGILPGIVTTAGTNVKLGQVANFVRVAATPYTFTCRIYSTQTGTELADGAETGVIHAWVLVT